MSLFGYARIGVGNGGRVVDSISVRQRMATRGWLGWHRLLLLLLEVSVSLICLTRVDLSGHEKRASERPNAFEREMRKTKKNRWSWTSGVGERVR